MAGVAGSRGPVVPESAAGTDGVGCEACGVGATAAWASTGGVKSAAYVGPGGGAAWGVPGGAIPSTRRTSVVPGSSAAAGGVAAVAVAGSWA